MSHRLPRLGLLLSALLSVAAIVLWVVLNNRTGGPPIRLSSPYGLKATFKDTQQLQEQSPVLTRGVPVGNISRIQVDGARAVVSFELDDRYARIYRDATVRLGSRSVLGEPFVDLDPGHPAAGSLPSGSTLPASQSSENVELEEALRAFSRPARTDLKALQRTFGRVARAPRAAELERAGWRSLRRIVREVRTTTEILHGQDRDLAGFVTDGRAVLGELGQRERALDQIVSGGRATLAAIASRRRSLEDGLAELPRLLETGRRTLAHAHPLLVEARPLMRDLRAASPELTPAFRDLRPAAADAERVIEGLPRLVDAALPTLEQALPVMRQARPVARRSGPALRNLVPLVRYIAPYKRSYSAYFSNNYHGVGVKDSLGWYARFQITSVPFMSQGRRDPGGGQYFSINNYVPPDDPLAPVPPGFKYPRLTPFMP